MEFFGYYRKMSDWKAGKADGHKGHGISSLEHVCLTYGEKMKIAFINQRYGLEVAGGSESYTRAMAEHLAEYLKGKAEVEVLTSKASDYITWEDDYEEDVETIHHVTVRRFSVKHKRSRALQRGAGILMRYFHIHFKWLEELRLKARGPYVPKLVSYIREHRDEYDAFIFVTYLYYPAYFGAKEVYDKAWFIPTAHDEEPIYMNIYKELFTKVKGIVYLTSEEKTFVEGLFKNREIPNRVLGMGIEVSENADENRFRQKYDIWGDYLLFAGRIEENKGCRELVDYFVRYKEQLCEETGENAGGKQRELTLLLMGKSLMEIPERNDIRYVGFVSDRDKYDGMKGAKVICLPSKYESFSISLLEGMAFGNPALVNGECHVLKGHVERSGGGFYYTGYEEFKEGLRKLLEPDVNEETGKKAVAYVREEYGWDRIIGRFCEMLSGGKTDAGN